MNDYKPRSLNYEKRVLEFHKISGENLKTLQRLKSVKPQYSTSMWESEFKEHINIKKNLSMFPSTFLSALWYPLRTFIRVLIKAEFSFHACLY